MLGRFKIEWMDICEVLRTVPSTYWEYFKWTNILQKWGYTVRDNIMGFVLFFFLAISPNI